MAIYANTCPLFTRLVGCKSMPTYTASLSELKQGLCTFEGKEAHHLVSVLRVKPGERIDLTDGSGRLFEGRIQSAGIPVTISVVRELHSPLPYPVHLFVSFLKREKMEFIVEKAIELNLSSVSFVKTRNSVRTEISGMKWERMARVA